MLTEGAEQRNVRLMTAERTRAEATRDAELEFSETVRRLRARFEADLAAATAHRIARVRPAHQRYNRAVTAAERGDPLRAVRRRT
jgi:molybdopterin synthase catalytic subunit